MFILKYKAVVVLGVVLQFTVPHILQTVKYGCFPSGKKLHCKKFMEFPVFSWSFTICSLKNYHPRGRIW